MPICRLCLKEEKLIKAHIIPESFYGKDTFLVTNTSEYLKRRPIGVYDNTILCKICDNEIGAKFDDFAKTILIDNLGVTSEIYFDQNSNEKIKVSRLVDKNGYSRLAKFFISVLWRASIASCEEFRNFKLGPFEDIARRIIITDSEDDLDLFSVAICQFNNFNERIQVISPKLIHIEDINFYTFITANLKLFIKCDKRKTPKKLDYITMSKKNDILMVDSDISSFPEYKALVLLAIKSQYIRNKKNHK